MENTIITQLQLTQDEINQGYLIISGQKTTFAIEQLCEESELATKQIELNQYY